MGSRVLCRVAFVLLGIGAFALGWSFVKGWTAPGSDGRTEIRLAPAERDQILAEMRDLLKAVHGVVDGLSQPDEAAGRKQAEQAARSVGLAMAADVNPALMAKLPLAFKQMGMSVHQDFDGIGEALAQGEAPVQILTRLSSISSRCTTCHEMYRLSGGNR
jgi:hypothetical protein